jgi:tetratricopeptide (TPR) repeat protein
MELAEATLGPDHSTTRQARFGVALSAIARGDREKAETLLRPLWEDHKRIEGEDSAGTLSVQGKLAETLQLLNKLDEAEALLRRTLEARRRLTGPDHLATYTIQSSLGMALQKQGKFQEAADLFDHTLKGYQKTLRPGHVLIGFMQSHLGETLAEMGKYAEAEALLKEGFETMDNSEIRDARRSSEGAERLATMYRKWGKEDQAALWEAKAEALKSQIRPQSETDRR